MKRERLTDCVVQAGAMKLVLIRAPAGFGKTTAMSQLRNFMQARGVATAWLTLSNIDNDVSRFLASLATAAGQLGLEQIEGGRRDAISRLTDKDAPPFALFVDDLEVIRSDSGVRELLKELLERLPRNGLLVVASRVELDLGLGRLRARNQLLEIDSELLRFTDVEALEFLRLRGVNLPVEARDRALEKAEGWITALWLLCLASQRGNTPSDIVARLSASDRDIADYLTEEVLAQQPRDVRQFLLRTSILRSLSLTTCQALLPNVDCAAILAKLERENIFLVAVGDTPKFYRYHSQFADFLYRLLLKEAPGDVARLNLAASGAYESQGRPVPAIHHAIEGGDYPHALSLLGQHGQSLLEQGRMRLLDRWFSAIPAVLLDRNPMMQLTAAWARCFTQGAWTAAEWLEKARGESDPTRQVQAHIRALTTVQFAMMDRYEDAIAAGRSALTHPPSGNPFIDTVLSNAMAHIVSITGDCKEARRFLDDAQRVQGVSGFNRMYTETVGGMLDLREGRLRQATARFRLAITSSSGVASPNYTHGNAWAGVPYASALYEANDLAGAERLINVYLPLARDVGLADHVITSYRIRARIAFLKGEVDTAFQAISELEYLGHERRLPRVTASAKVERSRAFLAQGHLSAAREELERANEPGAWPRGDSYYRPSQESDDLLVGRTRFALHHEIDTPLLAELEAGYQQASRLGRVQRALKLRILLALGHQRSGDRDRALQEFLPVLRECSREGFVRLLLDEGPSVGTLIRRAQESLTASQDPLFDAYLRRLAELQGLAPGEDNRVYHSPISRSEILSRSEIRILELLAEGYSNTALTERLQISNSTVRTHVRNIYAKLGCHNRMQAVAIARRKGLIR